MNGKRHVVTALSAKDIRSDREPRPVRSVIGAAIQPIAGRDQHRLTAARTDHDAADGLPREDGRAEHRPGHATVGGFQHATRLFHLATLQA